MNQESSSEKNILAVLVIVLGLVSVISIAAAFVFFNRANEAELGELLAKKGSADAERFFRAGIIEIESMKTMIGAPLDSPPEEVRATFEADIQKYAPDLPEGQRTYRQALEHVWRKTQAGK